MKTAMPNTLSDFQWQTQPRAAALVQELVDDFITRCPDAAKFAERLLNETGTRLFDWVFQISLNPDDETAAAERIEAVGYEHIDGGWRWRHPQGIFPEIVLDFDWLHPPRVMLKVDSVVDFLAAQGVTGRTKFEGGPFDDYRIAKAFKSNEVEVRAIERHAWPVHGGPHKRSPRRLARLSESFRLRRRAFDHPSVAFDATRKLINKSIRMIGADRACDLFFAADREYWMRRNRAAQVQYARQQKLGLGWANHDHHTYRSSRGCFVDLIALFEKLGFQCRERFYAGAEAGWGAQVLEQPNAGIVIFADVDLSPDEVTMDFAHERLEPRKELGTVGLWCALHGESIFEAGMHHLECQFDFDAARSQLAECGIKTMAPFTDMPHLKQAFTEGEVWPVDPKRLERLLAEGYITAEQAEKFAREGAIGSHMEILERNDGYKGFNQTGISEIIRKTDPRGDLAIS